MEKSYIGITGPVNNREVEDICREFSEAGYSESSKHIPMLGFLVSYKTLNNLPTKNKKYPSIEKIPQLLTEAGKGIFTTLHYNTPEEKIDRLVEQVKTLFDKIYQENLCRGIQLNIKSLPVKQVQKIKEYFSEMKIIFQANKSVTFQKTPSQIADYINDYGNLLSYVLIDPSGGEGLNFNIKTSVDIFNEIRNKNPDLAIGFAGGLSGKNVKKIILGLKSRLNHDNFSIDAESGLRDNHKCRMYEYHKYDNNSSDILNIGKVKDYLQSSSLVFDR